MNTLAGMVADDRVTDVSVAVSVEGVLPKKNDPGVFFLFLIPK
jgi:hypothetical protein